MDEATADNTKNDDFLIDTKVEFNVEKRIADGCIKDNDGINFKIHGQTSSWATEINQTPAPKNNNDFDDDEEKVMKPKTIATTTTM